jgi:CDP-glycerol glycerophosphotransferase (TagB/SpsB family)
VFLGESGLPGNRLIATFGEKTRIARFLAKRAAFVAYTGRPPPRRNDAVSISLWHGMPIKGIGGFDAAHELRSIACDLAITTSPRTAEIIARSFGLDPSTVLICGEPKTDPLPTDLPGWDFCVRLRREHRAVIGYFPTWREKIVELGGKSRRLSDDAALAELIGRLATTPPCASCSSATRRRSSFVRMRTMRGRSTCRHRSS